MNGDDEEMKRRIMMRKENKGLMKNGRQPGEGSKDGRKDRWTQRRRQAVERREREDERMTKVISINRRK